MSKKPAAQEESGEEESQEPAAAAQEPNVEQAVTPEIIASIANHGGFYDFQAVNYILSFLYEGAGYDDLSVIAIDGGDYLRQRLQEFHSNNEKTRAIIPLHIHDNHFVGIYLVYDYEHNIYRAIYFDPAGCSVYEDIPQNVREILSQELGIARENIILTRNKIQSITDDVFDNNHCGAFVNFVLSALVDGKIAVDENGNLMMHYYNGVRNIGDLSCEESDSFGKFLRDRDKSLVENSVGLEVWKEGGIAKLESIRMVYLKKKFKDVMKKSDSGGVKVSDKQKKYISGTVPKKTAELRHRSSSFPVVEVGDDIRLRQSGKGCGYDENFKTSDAKKYVGYDKKFGIGQSKVNFKSAFVHSRLRTHDYAHEDGAGGISGHIGGVYKDNSLSSKAQKTKGSTGFHAERHKAITRVIDDPTVPNERKPIAATVEALKFTVNGTLGYKDLQRGNLKFEGHTAAGLDLSVQEEREAAFKTFQAARDKRKIASVALTNPDFNFANLDGNSLTQVLQDGGMSPVRSSTPYSGAVIEDAMEKLAALDLNHDDSFEGVAKVYSESPPVFRPVPSSPAIPHYALPTASSRAKEKEKKPDPKTKPVLINKEAKPKTEHEK